MEVRSIEALEAIYGQPGEAATVKVTPYLTEGYSAFVEHSHFCVLTTVGPEGTDASPRGDDGPVVRILDAGTLALPDWKGNERIDSLRNIVRDGRVSLMFFVQGSNNVIRVNGRAVLSVDAALLESFARGAAQPRTVALVRVEEAYSQCARALIRARLWSGENRAEGLPSVGDMLREITEGGIDGAAYDAAWPVRAAATMW